MRSHNPLLAMLLLASAVAHSEPEPRTAGKATSKPIPQDGIPRCGRCFRAIMPRTDETLDQATERHVQGMHPGWYATIMDKRKYAIPRKDKAEEKRLRRATQRRSNA